MMRKAGRGQPKRRKKKPAIVREKLRDLDVEDTNRPGGGGYSNSAGSPVDQGPIWQPGPRG
jgi:hypothetical protein